MKAVLVVALLASLLLPAECANSKAYVRARRRKDKPFRAVTEDKLPAGRPELLAAGFKSLEGTPPLVKKPPEEVAALAAHWAAKREESSKYWSGIQGGAGSSRNQTALALSVVRTVVNMLGLRSMVDAACGELEWMPTLLQALEEDIANFEYFGVDISPTVIKDNQQRYKNHTRWEFAVRDISKDPTPLGYDLIFCRDVLQHLPCEAIVDALQFFTRSDASYLLVGSYNADRNRQVQAGHYFDINLRKAPFKLTEIVRLFNEHTSQLVKDSPDKLLLLYDMKYLRSQNFTVMKDMCGLLGSA